MPYPMEHAYYIMHLKEMYEILGIPDICFGF